MEKSLDFYGRLGFVLDKEAAVGDIRLAFLSAGTCLIELIAKAPETANPGPIDHIAMAVEDVDKAVAAAIKNGINIDPANINSVDILGGVRNVFFEGPDGERLEFFAH